MAEKTPNQQLAEKLYVSFQTVSKWETGTTSPDLSQIVPLARLFGITTDELFDFNESSEKLMRDAKLFQIFEGTNQIQRVVVAGSMLK